MHARCISVDFESQNIDQRQRHSDVHLSQHGIGHVGHCVFVACIQFADKQVDDAEDIGNHHHEVAYQPSAPSGYGEEEIDAGHCGDEAVDLHVWYEVVYQSGVLPQGESCYEGEECHHCCGSEKSCHHDDDKEHPCDGADNEIEFLVVHRIVV